MAVTLYRIELSWPLKAGTVVQQVRWGDFANKNLTNIYSKKDEKFKRVFKKQQQILMYYFGIGEGNEALLKLTFINWNNKKG